MAEQQGGRAGRTAVWVLVAVAAVAAVAAGVWWFINRKDGPEEGPDMVAVLRLNNKGIGHMEQFEYRDAVAAFEKVVEMAPDWEPGRINLGIALLNRGGKADVSAGNKEAGKTDIQRATEIFESVKAKDEKNPYANYCLGILKMYYPESQPDAIRHFKTVLEVDPRDASSWVFMATLLADDPEARRRAYEKALELDPNSRAALNNLQVMLRLDDVPRAERMLERFNKLKAVGWLSAADIKYSEMGKYAEVIGRTDPPGGKARTGPLPILTKHDAFKATLAPGAAWAKAAELGTGPVGDLRRAVRQRFGAVCVALDYDKDGKTDLLLLGAVTDGGQPRDLLLRQEGPGQFRDVTAEAGLGGARPSLGCTAGDFDNDGFPDLVITGAGRQWLYRNAEGPKGRHFVDVSADAGLDKLDAVALGATFVDLDNDGDLDLLVAQYAATPAEALGNLSGKASAGPGLAAFLNVGEAPPGPAGKGAALKVQFRRVTDNPALTGQGVAAVNQSVADLDGDRDVDVLLLADGQPPTVVLNDRLLAFRRVSLPEQVVSSGPWNGALVLDGNRDWRSDLFFVGPKAGPVYLRNQPGGGERDLKKWFEPAPTNSPPLLQALAVDLDLDGWTDVVGLSSQRRPVFLHNDSERFVVAAEALGSDAAWPADLVAVTVADADGDGLPDLLVWSEGSGLQMHRNRGNGNHALFVELTGRRQKETSVRCNADGLGAWVVVQASDVSAGQEVATMSAGLGQSSQPLVFGLGRHAEAEVVRLRWPDGTWQAELSKVAGQVARIMQENRKPISCPVLFTWDGRRFVFVNDFIGAGTVGEPLPTGGHRPPRPEESLKIEAAQLVPRDGKYVLRVTEPMDEVTYLDRLQLLVVDHPRDVRVYPDERFATGKEQPTQDLLAWDSKQEVFPARALDHKGRDMTSTLRQWDRDTADGFAHRAWIGFAEEHWVELDFGDRLSRFGPGDRLVLCLAGWTDYPYPESIWAAHQAGMAPQPPVLERLGEDGKWHAVLTDPGFPAGMPRMMTVDVTGKLTGPRCVLRLRTNMQIYWDQVFVAPVLERSPGAAHQGKRFRTTPLDVKGANLEVRGCTQEFSPDGKLPRIYDYDRIDRVPVSRLAGKMTKLGDVTELLRTTDDRYVIFGPGDEVSVSFDAASLPPLPEGWTRSFVLRTWGYCKDCAPFTATGGTVEPLPFRGMSNFPYGPGERYPRTPLHEEYRREWNTRQVGR